MRLLIAGGAGFLDSYLTDALHEIPFGKTLRVALATCLEGI